MKHQPFFTKLKKILAYPFNLGFINNQQKAIKLLNAIYESCYGELQQKYDVEKAIICQETIGLRDQLNRCWDLHDVTPLLGKEIKNILWKNKLNIQIFDLKTKWFLWEKIILSVYLIDDDTKKNTALNQLRILQQISSIFDLGK